LCRHAHSLLPFVSRRTVPITIPVRVLCTIIIEERSTVADDRQTDRQIVTVRYLMVMMMMNAYIVCACDDYFTAFTKQINTIIKNYYGAPQPLLRSASRNKLK